MTLSIDQVRQHLLHAISQLNWQVDLSALHIQVKQNTSHKHGDFSTNIALQLAKPLSKPAVSIAEAISQQLEQIESFTRIEIAGAGFINIFLSQHQYYNVVEKILKQPVGYAQGTDKNKRVLVEFVSSNPTGPLHVGHGRCAVFGDSLVRLLRKAGFKVDAEYYINDAGRQIDILTISVLLRYVEKYTDIAEDLFRQLYPEKVYQGDYIIDIADKLSRKLSARQKQAIADLNYDRFIEKYQQTHTHQIDPEYYVDQLIIFVKQSSEVITSVFALGKKVALKGILHHIKHDLQETGIIFDRWFSEQSLVDDGSVEKTLSTLESLGQSYKKDGAIWFKSTQFGDDKDRVLVRQDGFKTYLAHDIAYHQNKYDRGYDHIINIWGADHHGYICRVVAAMRALGYDANRLLICVVQLANLFRGKQKIAMSTRSGEFVPLSQLREEIGNDATRFFYNLNRADQHLNFDLRLAVEKSNDNPVFYVQYAYARIRSLFRRLEQRGQQWQPLSANLSLLTTELEGTLIRTLSMYPQKIQEAADKYSPHIVILYVRELSTHVHQYYNQSTILVEQENLRNARLNCLYAAGIVIQDALGILGVSAPETM